MTDYSPYPDFDNMTDSEVKEYLEDSEADYWINVCKSEI